MILKSNIHTFSYLYDFDKVGGAIGNYISKKYNNDKIKKSCVINLLIL